MNDEKKGALGYAAIKDAVTGSMKKTVSDITDAYEVGSVKNPVSGMISAGCAAAGHITPLIHTCAGLIFSGTRILFGIRPFGISFLSASGKYLLWSYVGSVLSAVISSDSPFIDIAVYTLILCLRRLISMLLGETKRFFDFSDGIRIKMAVSLIGAVVFGAYHAFSEDFSLISLSAFLLYIAASPIFTFLYSWAVSGENDTMRVIFYEVGCAAAAFSVVLSARGVTVFSFDLAVMSGMILTVYAVHKYGLLKGSLFGLLLGFSCAAELVPMFAVAGVVSGVLISSSPYLAVTAAVLSAVSWATYAGGYFFASEVGGSVIASGVILGIMAFGGVFDKSRTKTETDTEDLEIPSEAQIKLDEARERETNELLSSASAALEGLSEMLYRLSDKLRTPSRYDIREAVMKGKRGVCRKCKRRDRCYTENASESENAWDSMTATLYKNGIVTEEDTPPYIEESCPSPSAVTESVNVSYSELLKSLIETDKTEVMAFDYSAMSMVLKDVLVQREGKYDINTEMSKKLYKKLTDEGVVVSRVCVFGERRKTVFIENIRLSELSIGEDDLRCLTSRTLGGEYTSPEFEVRGASVNATLTSAESYSLRFDKAQRTMEESSASGDCAVGFPARGSRFCALISDGMGSGREAALTSGMCALFIEKMMSAGHSATVTLKMLNAMIRAKGSECSATVDLMEYDLITGEAKFIKSGAAPSFIVRGNEVYKIDSKTIPVGIIRSLDAEQTTVKTEVGDIIIMMSDGVFEGESDEAWLYSLFADSADRRVSDMTERLIREAERRLQKKDDATVCVLRVAPPRITA